MHLLHTKTHKLEQFGAHELPLYAILSHTWGKDEITFQDIQTADVENDSRCEKIRNACSVAARHGFDYIWIDTCCIDKSSSAELSEAINSMFRWYQQASVCYAYLADVQSKSDDHLAITNDPEFAESNWFKRGWTLQELIAPSIVIFFDQKWQEIGTKSTLLKRISNITGILENILLGDELKSASVAQRMSWASRRDTTRIEDRAYCLLGIFGVNMPMLYGEGERAFIRLQEEIIKVSDDYSIFAWALPGSPGGLLAPSPAGFSKSGSIVPLKSSSSLSSIITIDNKGTHLKLGFKSSDKTPYNRVTHAILPCVQEEDGEAGKYVIIFVKSVSETEEYFERLKCHELRLIPSFCLKEFICEKRICIRQERLTGQDNSLLHRAAFKGNEAVVKLLLEKGADPKAKDKNGEIPLRYAAENGHDAVAELLVGEGMDFRAPLFCAVTNGHEKMAKLLLESGADPNAEDEHGRTPFWFAVLTGHEAVVKLLLDAGADFNESNNQAYVLAAADYGHEAVVKLLLERGANPEATDLYCETPLWRAACNGHEAVVKLLLERTTSLKTLKSRDPDSGRTSVWISAFKGHGEVVKLLLERLAALDAGDTLGGQERPVRDYVTATRLLKSTTNSSLHRDALFAAAEGGHEALVRHLLERHAGLYTNEDLGEALWYVTWRSKFRIKRSHEAVIKLLLDKNAALEFSKSGTTPLWNAIYYGHGGIAKLLLERDPNLETSRPDRWPLTSAAAAAMTQL